MPLLQTKGLGIRFGGLQALQDVNLTDVYKRQP